MLNDYLDEWWQKALGSHLLALEKSKLDTIVAELPGNFLLQPSSLLQNMYTLMSPITQKISVADEFCGITERMGKPKPRVVMDFQELPFLDDRFDVVLLPHVLEFATDAERVMAECYRVLRPDGHIIILGFNPWSCWGLWRYWQRYTEPKPWGGKFISPMTIKHWLRSLECDVVEYEHLFYRPPINNEKLLKKLHFLEYLNQLPWLGFGAAYIFVAQKKIIPIKTIPIKWKSRKVVMNSSLVKPTTRSILRKTTK